MLVNWHKIYWLVHYSWKCLICLAWNDFERDYCESCHNCLIHSKYGYFKILRMQCKIENKLFLNVLICRIFKLSFLESLGLKGCVFNKID